MAQRLLHDSEADAELRRGAKYAERASGGSDQPTSAETAKTEATAKAAEKKNAPGLGARAAYGAGAVGGAGIAGLEATGAAARQSTSSAWEGLKNLVGGTGPHPEDVGKGGLTEALSSLAGRVVGGKQMAEGLIGVLASPLSGAKAAAEKYMESLPESHQNAMALEAPAANLVRNLMGEPSRQADMTVKELAGHVAQAAVIAHGATAKGEEAAGAPEPTEKPAAPNAARFAAAAPEAEPPTAGPFKATPEWQAAYVKRFNWERAQKAAQPAPAAPEAAPAAEPAPYAGPERRAVHEGTVPPVEAKGIEQAPGVAETAGLPGDIAEARINAENGVVPEEPVVVPRATDIQPGEPEPGAPAEPVAQATPGEVEPGSPEAPPAPEQPTSPLQQGDGTVEQPVTPDTAQEAPAEPSPVMPEEAQPATPDPVQEQAQPEPSAAPAAINTVNELNAAAAPAVEPLVQAKQGALDAAERERVAREEANTMAADMRAAGASREDINTAYRAKLNESGIRSKRQIAADEKLQALDPGQVQRGISAAVMESPADPEPVIVRFLKKLGLPDDMANDIADRTTEALKNQGLDDGAGGIDLTKQENAPFDRVAANRALAEKVRTLCP